MVWALLLATLVAAQPVWALGTDASGSVPLAVETAERLLVIAPHPDDETLGTGGLMQRVLARGGSVQIILITAGDGYVEAVQHETGKIDPTPAAFIAYGKERLREAHAAVGALGDGRARLLLLGFPDGGLDDLLRTHGRSGSPERSPTTGATEPPYEEAVAPDVLYDGDDLLRQLRDLIRTARPTMVALPDPFDRHHDHSAAGVFALRAVTDWIAALPTGVARPRVLSYLVHWPDWPPGWNASPPLSAETPLELPAAFPRLACRRTTLTLTPAEVAAKRAALRCYQTQQRVMSGFLAAFERRREPFCLLALLQ